MRRSLHGMANRPIMILLSTCSPARYDKGQLVERLLRKSLIPLSQDIWSVQKPDAVLLTTRVRWSHNGWIRTLFSPMASTRVALVVSLFSKFSFAALAAVPTVWPLLFYGSHGAWPLSTAPSLTGPRSFFGEAFSEDSPVLRTCNGKPLRYSSFS